MFSTSVSRVVAVVTACVSSTCAFLVISRSGIAGTLIGAAAAGLVYSTTSQWLNASVERARKRRQAAEATVEEGEAPVEVVAHAPFVAHVPEAMAGETAQSAGGAGSRKARWRSWAFSVRPLAKRWAPAALGLVALTLSAVALAGGEPGPQIVKERVVVKPVVQERVIVTERTVPVPVYVTVASGGGGSSSGSTGAKYPAAGETQTPTTATTAQNGSTTTSVTRPVSTTATTPHPTSPESTPEVTESSSVATSE